MDKRRVVAGRYRLIGELGRGGMSVVHRAHDLVLDRDVAVKIIAAADADGKSLDVRAEALATARLAHPHVATVHDFVEEDGQAFVVMELLDGEPLSRIEAPMAPDAACQLVAQVATALAAAHATGLVHRDVKPGNIMLTPTGPKVFDFGLAATAGTAEEIGERQTILGTPAYVAPERLAAAAVTPASDVYSLGVVLYWLLTQQLPWSGDTAADLVAARLNTEPAALPSGLSPAVGLLYRRCLARDPESRPTARDIAVTLAIAAHLPTPRDMALDQEPEAGATVSLPIRHTLGRSRTVILTGAGAALLGSVAVAAVLSGGAPPKPEALQTTGPGPTTSSPPFGGPPDPASDPVPASPTPPDTTRRPVATGAVPGAGGTPPDRTVAQATSSPTRSTPAPTTPSGTLLTSLGGEVEAACVGTNAVLLSWTPATGYIVTSVEPGPAAKAMVKFKSDTLHTTMEITCPAGTLVLKTKG